MGSSRNRFPRAGDVIAGRYRLESVLARGGMGMVCLARQLSLDREVALKMLLPQNLENETTLRRFEREVHLAKQLRHPNVVELYDFGRTDDELLYLVMELLEGRDLKEIIRSDGPMTVERCGHIALQALDALSVAHQRGIVHRDLKPSNLFITKIGRHDDFVKLLDFGIAKSLGTDDDTDVTRQGHVCGTSAYMAPEMFLFGSADLTVDIYAMGIIMMEMLIGQKVFQGSSTAENMMLHLRGEMAFPPALRETPLADVLSRALARRPKMRFQDAGEMLDALEGAMEEMPGDLTVADDVNSGVAVLSGENILDELLGDPDSEAPDTARTADSSEVMIIEQETGKRYSPPAIPVRPDNGYGSSDEEVGAHTAGLEHHPTRKWTLPAERESRDRETTAAADAVVTTEPMQQERDPDITGEEISLRRSSPFWLPAGVVAATTLIVGFALFYSIASSSDDEMSSSDVPGDQEPPTVVAPTEVAAEPSEPPDEAEPTEPSEPTAVADPIEFADANEKLENQESPDETAPEPEPLTWRISVESDPDGAAVYARGRELGKTPTQLEFGQAELPGELKLVLRGHESATIPLKAGPDGGNVTVEHEFERLRPDRRTTQKPREDLHELLSPGRFD